MSNYVLIIDFNNDSDGFLYNNLCFTSLIVVRNNIYDLEKMNNSYIPFLFNKNDIDIFYFLLSKKKITNIFIVSNYPYRAEIFTQINFLSYNKLYYNLFLLSDFIKKIILYTISLNFIFIIHEYKKNQFLLYNQLINSFVINIMNNIYNEFYNINKIKINCLITNFFDLNYKKKINIREKYNKNNNKDLIKKICFNISKLGFSNKIFKIFS